MNSEKIAAIILAAGFSSRMSEFKPLLPLGGMNVLQRAIRVFQRNRINDIRVVIGYRAADLLSFLQKGGIRRVLNENHREGMFSSAVAGINSLESDRKAFFLLPVDIPLVRPQTVADLLQAFPEEGEAILYPTFQGKRGHPPLISAGYGEKIGRWQEPGGLRSFLRQYEAQSRHVEVADRYILRDIDTPADYQDLMAALPKYEIPHPQECLVLLAKKFSADKFLLDHSRKVAQIAVYLAEELNRSGGRLDTELIAAAGLLHDLAKGQPHHAKTGEEILGQLGFTAVAKIVGTHTDIFFKDEDPPAEEEVLYLADKMVRGDQVVPLEERCREIHNLFSSNPQAGAAAAKRWADAFRIKEKIEKKTGRTLSSILGRPIPDGLFTETWGN